MRSVAFFIMFYLSLDKSGATADWPDRLKTHLFCQDVLHIRCCPNGLEMFDKGSSSARALTVVKLLKKEIFTATIFLRKS